MNLLQQQNGFLDLIRKVLVRGLLCSSFAMDLAYADMDSSYDRSAIDTCTLQYSGDYGFIEGDLLYWRPYIGGMQFEFQTVDYITTVADAVTTNTIDEVDTDPHFKWNCGYRVGAGYNFSDCFDLAGFWTSFDGHANQSVVDSAGKWRINFNQFDVVGRYKISFESGYAQPFLGLRGARITQHVISNMQFNIFTPTTSYVNLVTLDDHQKFEGIGPVLGFNINYDVGCGFGLFGSLSGSVMYGTFKKHWNDFTISPVEPDAVTLDTVHADTVNAAADLVLGFQWKTNFCDYFDLSLRVLGEHHQYFNQNYIGAYGDLSFDGVTFSAFIDI